jgi:radical SAM-linked protein
MRGGARFPIRIRYTKRGKVRFLGHRDVARNLERALRVARLPLAFSEGYSPHPKLSFGLALTTGYESDAEYLDADLAEPVDLEALPAALTAALPEGMTVVGVAPLDDRAPALQDSVTAVVWQVRVTDPAGAPAPIAELRRAVSAVLAAGTLECTQVRKGRATVVDIRPLVRRLEILDAAAITERDLCAVGPEPPVLEMDLATVPRGARPTEVLAALGPFSADRGLRTHQFIERDGKRFEPLDVDTRVRDAPAIAS